MQQVPNPDFLPEIMTNESQHPAARNERILVVDDSPVMCKVVKSALESVLDLPVDCAASLDECRALLAKHAGQYPIAVVDLSLPDAPDGEAVDVVLGANIATIVLTASLDQKLHEHITRKPISDYVIKQSPGAIETVQKDVVRILRNRGRKALVVDDSASFRMYLKVILETQRLQVLEAPDGKAALDIIEQNEIALVITDFEMPQMDGVALTARLRSQHPSSQVGAIGLTGSGDTFVGVRFLKAGANDIVRKPFLAEEFVGRLNNCLDHLDDIQTIQDQANRDYLTKLHNRRYFFETAVPLFNSARRGHLRLSAGMVDIDFFKRINDTYGHDVGDIAIVSVAQALKASFRGTDIVARMGGEEFCVLLVNAESPIEVFERLRQRIAAIQIPLENGEILRFTASIGVCATLGNSLEEMVNSADAGLYAAKHGGRNRVALFEKHQPE
ncbi:MAG: diguanylate cyclase [Nitrosomonadales bacterium]|nr:diguanylate cyclase [Nitrosomonadales bacterium]